LDKDNDKEKEKKGHIFQVNADLEQRIQKLLRSLSHKVILTVALESAHAQRTRHLVSNGGDDDT
jgi:hypothetical protein